MFDPGLSYDAKVVQISKGHQCRVDKEGSVNGYLDCDGTWKRIWPAAVDNKFDRLSLPSDGPGSSGLYAIRVSGELVSYMKLYPIWSEKVGDARRTA